VFPLAIKHSPHIARHAFAAELVFNLICGECNDAYITLNWMWTSCSGHGDRSSECSDDGGHAVIVRSNLFRVEERRLTDSERESHGWFNGRCQRGLFNLQRHCESGHRLHQQGRHVALEQRRCHSEDHQHSDHQHRHRRQIPRAVDCWRQWRDFSHT
jgi:hypothetical protein